MSSFIVIAIALIVFERGFFKFSSEHYSWMRQYFDASNAKLAQVSFKFPHLRILAQLLPVVFGAAVLSWLLSGWFLGLLHLAFSVFLLLYVFGPYPINTQVKEWIETPEDPAKTEFFFDGYPDANISDEDVWQCVLRKSHERCLSVIFWFAVLGPVAAVFTASARYARHYFAARDDEGMKDAAWQIFSVIDWIPQRITALIYTLVGQFGSTFALWLKKIVTEPRLNDDLILPCAEKAMGEDSLTEDAVSRANAALGLANRCIYAWLGLMAIFAVGYLFG